MELQGFAREMVKEAAVRARFGHFLAKTKGGVTKAVKHSAEAIRRTQSKTDKQSLAALNKKIRRRILALMKDGEL